MPDKKISTTLSSTSVWTMRSDADTSSIKEGIDQLRKESDRSVAIIGGTIVELTLTAALKAFLHPDTKITDELFRTTGALGAFGTKIDLGYLVGLYGKDAHRDLVTTKDIRNAFAHSLQVRDFDSQKIRAWCLNLKLAERHTADMPSKEWHGSFEAPPVGEAPASLSWIGMQNRAASLANPRERYLISAQVFCIGLSIPAATGMPLPLF